MKISCHNISLPITRFKGHAYNLTDFQLFEDFFRLSGFAGGPRAAESTNIDIFLDGEISVYETKNNTDKTKFYHKRLIREFVEFLEENIDTNCAVLSNEDVFKIECWADEHNHFKKFIK